MRLSEAKIGYAGYSTDCSRPGDRRRFVAYARQRGLVFETARLDQDYDVVVFTYCSDITGWLAKRRRDGRRPRLIFELVDSYLTQTHPLRRYLKGFGRYADGTESRLGVDLLYTLRRACAESDAVLCSTPEQRAAIAPYNDRAFVSFDYFDDEVGVPKRDYATAGRLKVVWEGQAVTLHSLATIRVPLNRLADRLELHVVTDPSIARHLGRIGRIRAEDIVPGIECPTIFHQWRGQTFSTLVKQCDVVAIPMNAGLPMIAGKPENKLIMMWKMGMPVLAGPTPAYRRTMAAAGLPEMLCATPDAWLTGLERLAGMAPHERATVAQRGYEYANERYSAECFRAPFDEAFQASGFSV